MEAEIASLRTQTDSHKQELRDIWERLQKATIADSKLELILYRLDELTKALDRHDAAETERFNSHDKRIVDLETVRAEQDGAWKAVVGVASSIGAVVGAVAAAAIEHYIKP